MGIVAKYKFNQNIYENYLPEFNSEFTNYTITDSISGDGYTIRTVESDSLPQRIKFGESASSYVEKGIQSLIEILFVNIHNEMVSFDGFLSNARNLISVNTDGWDTSGIVTMQQMFHGCSSLTSLDVSNFNTEKVTNMYSMFYNCKSLTSLDVSNFNTEKVTKMDNMFFGCSSLTSLNVSNFNTKNVTTMSWMFSNCSSLISLDVSNFNTSQATFIDAMFANCPKLASINVSNFDTGKATNMSYIFQNCSSLTSIDVSNWNTIEVTNMRNMFFNCHSLTSLDISNFNTNKVTDMTSMFNECFSLSNMGMIYCNSDTINKISSSLLNISTNTKIYYSLPDISELEPHDNIEYVKYIFPTRIQLPPHIQLHRLPDGTCDEVDIKTGILIRRIDENYNLLEEEVTEKLILNYNNSCNYGVILPRGTSDNYNVITNEYRQNLDFIPIDGSIAFDTATIKDTTVKYSVALSKFEVDTTNVRGSDGIYCDNDLFKYEASDNDYEHAYIENDTTLHIYVNKSRLSSYDQVGFQMYLTNNPFDLYYAIRNTIISYVNYEDLNPEKASWEMLDCTEDGSITIESGNMDKTLLLDCMDYVAPTKNRFEIDLLKANTQYTVYAEGVSDRIQLNFGGNIVNFISGNVYTSGEAQLVEFYTDNEIKNLIIIEGDTRTETIDFFEGLKSSENVTVISNNAPFIFGKGGKIQ